MIDRKKFAEELTLRENVRDAIRVVRARRAKQCLTEEADNKTLRSLIRSFLPEGQTPVANKAKHDSTGINTLEDLLKNSNLLSVLETGYKSLTTDKAQRISYRNHILNAVEMSLAPEESRKEAGEDVEITEAVDIGIGDRPEDDPDFIDIDDDGKEDEIEVEPPDEREEFGLEGEDKTGRNRAFTDFHDIEKNILTAFDDLDNPEDMEMFEEYLIKNLSLYFDKFEGELSTNVEPPASAADAVADTEEEVVGAIGDTENVSELPEFELQEIASLFDIDDILKNIL
tara:strand:+ start:369 stop:1223 length:855 start_codon:yes stop_codon:yes gene_type:complete